MHELGILEILLKRLHQKLPQLRAQIGSTEVVMADFSRLPVQCPFIALMPQWDFLNFLAEHARRYSTFHLRTQAEVTGLIEDGGRVVGVRAKTPGGALEVRAQLVVAADGRNSIIRERSGLQVEDFGAPMDGLWFRLPRKPGESATSLRFDRGKIVVMIDRGDYWQCAFLIPKGGNEETQRRGLERLRASIVEIAPFLQGSRQ